MPTPPKLKEELSKTLCTHVPLIAVGGLTLLLPAVFSTMDPALAGVLAVFIVVGGIVVLAVKMGGGNPLGNAWIIVKTTVQIVAVGFATVVGALLLGGILGAVFPSCGP